MKIRAKKSLGQNFLNSSVVLSQVIEAGNLKNEDIVLEVGPGTGNLTEKILERAKKVVAVEKDDNLFELLKVKFSKEITEGKLELLHKDILEFEVEDYLPKVKSYKIVANIPYYITGIFLRKFLSEQTAPEEMVLMIQKEVAERIVATNNKESLLSLSVKVYGTPKYITTVDKSYFDPQPKVDSAILLIEKISKIFFIENDISEDLFFNLLKKGFAQKRKILLGNIADIFGGKENARKIFQELKILENARAEDLNLENWKELTKRMKKI